MSRGFTLRFDLPTEFTERNAVVHRIRDLGEDLFSEFSRSGLAQMDIEAIDSAIDCITIFAVKVRHLGEVEQTIKKILKKHGFTEGVQMEREAT
jgi:uncharacterized protein YutE (UPF0331/DUF86 family)